MTILTNSRPQKAQKGPNISTFDQIDLFQPVQMSAIRFRYHHKDIPREFDARSKWPKLSGQIYDQGDCGASWAFSTVSVASDRFVIDSKGSSSVQLSPLAVVSCNIKGQNGCNGGHIDRAWNFLRKYG